MGAVEWLPCHMDVEAAAAFVRSRGSQREQARLAGILDGVRPERFVVRELEQLQHEDGGFPLEGEPGGPSSIDATCYVLSQLKDMPPLIGSPMASRAIAFIRRNQAMDGAWAELPAAAAGGPPWVRAENLVAKPYLTANAAFTLVTVAPEQSEPARRAVRWLQTALADTPERQYALTLAMTWATRYRLEGGGGSDLRALFDLAISEHENAWGLAWQLSCALDVRAGGDYLLPVMDALVRLAAMQGQDGSWPAEDGLPVEATLASLRVFRGFGLI
ncbi:MAG: hypothetical protein ACM3XM_01680 [Mycobacterium leprae]